MTALKKWIVFAFASLAFVFATQASAQQDSPYELVKRVSVDVLEVAKKDRDIRKGNMQKIFRLVDEKVMPHVDFKKTTSLAVGKSWRQATPAQREELAREFRDLLFHTYASAISKVEDGHRLEVARPRAKSDATDVIVNSRIIQPKNPEPILLAYHLEKQSGVWKIYDISVMGAWLVETYRTTFAQEIARSGIDGLIKTLKDKNASLAKGGKTAR